MKRRLKKWVKVTLVFLVIIVIGAIIYSIYIGSIKEKNAEPQIEYGEILKVEIKADE